MNLNVENQYLALRQYKDESLLLYKRQIESTLKLFDAVGLIDLAWSLPSII